MIHPTSKFVLLKWVPKGESIAILLPDGARPSTVGPEVPFVGLVRGVKVLLRGDAPPNLFGVDEKKKLAMIHCDWIMAIVEDDESEKLDLPTDDQIRQIAGN